MSMFWWPHFHFLLFWAFANFCPPWKVHGFLPFYWTSCDHIEPAPVRHCLVRFLVVVCKIKAKKFRNFYVFSSQMKCIYVHCLPVKILLFMCVFVCFSLLETIFYFISLQMTSLFIIPINTVSNHSAF